MMTRLLVQKPADYAELEENARIAVSVLADDGWSIERIDDLQIRVTAVPVITKAEDPRLVQARAAVEASEMRYMVLRGIVTDLKDLRTSMALRFATIACSAGALCDHYGGRGWALVLAVVIFAASVIVQLHNKAKGAK